MKLRTISERIAYFPATTQPLSADVGLVRGDRFCWVFDVGNSQEVVKALQEQEGEKQIILSHFHQDHTANLAQIPYQQLYCGAYTREKLQKGTVIQSPFSCEDGVKLTLFPLPAVHEKGAVGLEVNEEYAFLGDAVYGARKKGKVAYNLNFVKDTIEILEKCRASSFLLSHTAAFVYPKAQVLARLKAIYALRTPGEAYLFLNPHTAQF
ncbi:MAG TPA: hypothetical protein DEP42_05375 [Ruminococcaceae bacterium]|nr:hypothetical protein [Oscillospiraceae bacterium]